MEAPTGSPVGLPPASLWAWIQRSASSPSLRVHTPTDKKSCPPLFCTWSFILSLSFLFLDASFHHPCTSFSLSKLLSNKQSVPSYFFPTGPISAASIPKFGGFFQCCYLGDLDFVWYYLYGCLGTGDLGRLCTSKLPYQYPVHTGIIFFTIYTH